MTTEILGYTAKGKPISRNFQIGKILDYKDAKRKIDDLQLVIESMEKRIIALEKESVNKFVNDKLKKE